MLLSEILAMLLSEILAELLSEILAELFSEILAILAEAATLVPGVDTIRIFLFFRLYLFAFKLPSELRDMITNLFEMNESIKINLIYGLADFAQ